MATVLVPLAQGVEELEAVTVVDLLRRAGIEVVTAGLDAAPVKGSRGTVLLPGGQPGATHLEQDARIVTLVGKMARDNRFIAAICAAPKVLARAGVLDGKRATSFPGALDPAQWPNLRLENRPVVTDGRVITSRGPGTAMDFALELIGLLAGKEKRDQVEAGLQRDK
jgi:4-methyl-5(b-hydroxyethyl)-thiazole monophosphate biosynthesis